MSTFQIKTEHRPFLAKVLREFPETRKFLLIMKRIGLKSIRPDVRHDRQADGTYKISPDYEAWNADCRNGIHVCLLRGSDGRWSIHS